MSSGYEERNWNGQFCGAWEIAQFAGVTNSQVAHWRNETDWFPKPLDEPRMGRVWYFPEVAQALSEQGYPREKKTPARRLRRKRNPLAAKDDVG